MEPAETRALIAGARWFDVELPPEAIARIGRFLGVLTVWNRRLRLIGNRDIRVIVEKHAVDSLAPVPLLPPEGLVIDLGSGGGFPGIILGCVRPDLELILMESRRRRVSFLREAIRSTPLPFARALDVRAEDASRDPALAGRAATVVARALRLDSFLALAAPFLAPSGMAIAMQTPRTAAVAESVAERHGLRLISRRDYTLPAGAARTLLRFTH
jgi:16S rRNA (guanine527-N7)-methyltransferase